jgi:hypothetical protein
MIIKNEMEDKIKFRVNKSKYITLKQNEKYNCDELGEVKIELIDPSLSNIDKFFKVLLLMPIVFILLGYSSESLTLEYNFIYTINIDNKEDFVKFETNDGCIILKKDNEILTCKGYSKLKSCLLFFSLLAYSFLIYFIIFIIIWKIKS